MILVALDVEGTLDTAGGPVPWKVVELLNTFTPPGIVRFAVASSSRRWPGPWPDESNVRHDPGLPMFTEGTLLERLAAAEREFPWLQERYYLGPLPEHEILGWTWVSPDGWPRIVARLAEVATAARIRA